MTSFRDIAGNEWAVKVTVGSLRRCIDEAGFDLLNLFGQKDAPPDQGIAEQADALPIGEGMGESVEGPALPAKSPPPVMRLFTDLELLGRCVYAVVKPQADAKRLDREQFLELLAGDAIGDARRALLDSCVSFYPSPAMRRAFRVVTDELMRVWEQAEREAEQDMAPEKIRQAMTTERGAGSIN